MHAVVSSDLFCILLPLRHSGVQHSWDSSNGSPALGIHCEAEDIPGSAVSPDNKRRRAYGAGEGEGATISLLELFCNPNAYSTAFDARVLITLKAAGGVAVTTEGGLSTLKADVENFLDQAA